jgi:hypothetical protein
MDLSKVLTPRAPNYPEDTQAQTSPAMRLERVDALPPFAASHAAIAASRSVLVRTIALLS